MTTCAFIFPGQGSQKLGMLSDFYSQSPLMQQTFEQASDSLQIDLWQLCQENEQKLNQTQYTQAVLLTASVALWRIWQDMGGPTPVKMAGHSLGEYSALVCSGALAFSQAVSLVFERGRFMQQAVKDGDGAMAAIIGLEDEAVVSACEQSAQGQVVQAVNFNAPGQVVVAGHRGAVERVMTLTKSMGAKLTVLLPVSVPSHCDLMKEAAQQLAERIASLPIASPEIPVIHNVDVKTHPANQDIGEALVKQLYSPVRWSQTICHLLKETNTLVECGPGKVLSGLNKRIARQACSLNIDSLAQMQQAIEMLNK